MATINSIDSNIPIQVALGGTGASSFTQYSPLIGQGTSSVTTITPGTDGQLLTAATGLDPAFATMTSSGGSIVFTAGAGTLSLSPLNGVNRNGSFAPVLTFGGGSTGITYSVQRCQYIRIASMVYVCINIVLTNKGTDTGTAAISLPVSISDSNNYALSAELQSGGSYANQLMCIASGSSLTLYNVASGAAATAFTNTNFANTSRLYISGCYLV